MKVVWICGLPEAVRREALERVLSKTPTAAWSWVMGHLPPPEGVELHIVCPVGGLIEPRIDFEYKGAHWHCFRRERFELFFLWRRFANKIRPFVRALAPDAIHGWGGETGCGRVATLLSRDAIVSVQGLLLLLFWQLIKVKGVRQKISFKTRLAWFCERQTYRHAHTLLVESEASRQGLEEYYNELGVLIPHPLRAEFLTFDLSCCNKTGSNLIKFVYLGSLIDRKGAIDAVKAFASISHPSTQLVMIGEGEARSYIERLISINNLSDKITLKGALNVDQILSEFKDAQFFLLPSYGDTGPTALKEALASGLYPICYRNSGPESIISHYGCGSLVRTGNVNELSAEIRHCIDIVQECCQRALAVALDVRKELTPNVVWNQLQQVYANVNGGNLIYK